MAVHDGRVVSNFLVQALRGEPLTIYGDGSQTRSFCYVDDLVEGLLRLMEWPDAAPGRVFPINLGNPEEYSMLQLAQAVRELVPCHLEYRDLPADDPTRRKPDITRAKTLLGWTPETPLHKGLLQTADYFRQTLRARED
jgi:UDP-glucuronate decarboxylase